MRCAFALCGEPATERVRHPMRPESRTLVCERHARRARAVAGDKIKCPPVNSPGRRGTATRGAQHREGGRGEGDSPTRVARPMTNASNSTPREGENVTGESCDWETFGRELLRGELERHGYALRDEFQKVANRAKRGEVSEADVEDLQQRLHLAQEFLTTVKTVQEEEW